MSEEVFGRFLPEVAGVQQYRPFHVGQQLVREELQLGLVVDRIEAYLGLSQASYCDVSLRAAHLEVTRSQAYESLWHLVLLMLLVDDSCEAAGLRVLQKQPIHSGCVFSEQQISLRKEVVSRRLLLGHLSPSSSEDVWELTHLTRWELGFNVETFGIGVHRTLCDDASGPVNVHIGAPLNRQQHQWDSFIGVDEGDEKVVYEFGRVLGG